MPGFEKTANFVTSFLIYTLLSVIVVVAGLKLVRYANDFKFYARYLLQWESALTKLSSKDVFMPVFKGDNHVEYMDRLVDLMEKEQITIPKSNTGRPYIYKLSDQDLQKNQPVFLLCFEKKIVLFGLSKTTFNMLDKKIDGTLGKNSGRFKGTQQKSLTILTGVWNL